ncbi:MAG: hypothetical protein RMH75_01445 [Archaeoglobaceae archaeon]|nr:hypothetical protein [Archaeoglobaceae archaeon]MDW7989325.1 hypothetical protein [Archaeoglobaceae archaeon]
MVKECDRKEISDNSNSFSRKLLVSVNEIVAIAKILSGLKFLDYYPITTASDEALFD